jgi:hypothetical protein
MRNTLLSALFGFLLPVTAVMGFNLWHDPYHYYRIPADGDFRTNARWQNPGLIRNYPYDTLLVGTSRSENFQPQMFQAAGWNVLKATAPGSLANEQLATIDLGLASGRVDRVIFEMSYTSFTADRAAGIYPFPEFLYEPSLETPFMYLLSYDLMLKGLPGNVERSSAPLEDLYVWWSKRSHEFTSHHVLKRLADSCSSVEASTIAAKRDIPTERYLDRFRQQVESSPDIEFIGFFPPVAALGMLDHSDQGLDARLSFRQALAGFANRYENFTLLDYASDHSIVMDLSRYRDVGHFDLAATRQIAQDISDQQGPVVNGGDVNVPLLALLGDLDRKVTPCQKHKSAHRDRELMAQR